MHVGLNLVYLVPGETGGMETYARELIPALLAEEPGLRITAFINREAAKTPGPWNELVESVTVPVRARNRLEWVRGEQQLLPRLAARAGVDLVHSLASTGPAWGRFRRIVTIQDLIYLLYPEDHGRVKAWGMGFLVQLAARHSDRIIVSSNATRNDLERLSSIPASRIDLVPFGPGASPVEPTASGDLVSKYSLDGRPVVLSVAAKRPRKNLLRLIAGLALIDPADRPVLVLPGYPTAHEPELRAEVTKLGVSSDVRFPGWISAADLEGFYGLANCVVLPSLYEGFGLPALEAMRRGVPVACSNRGALAEVTGGSARLFDPERPEEIADAIRALVSDRGLADQLRNAGLARARHYTWAATAQGTLRSYERALTGTMKP